MSEEKVEVIVQASKDMIPTGELFADWQTSATEILMINLLREKTGSTAFSNRAKENHTMKHTIEALMRERFTAEDLQHFLDHGFPRQINLDQIIISKEGAA